MLMAIDQEGAAYSDCVANVLTLPALAGLAGPGAREPGLSVRLQRSWFDGVGDVGLRH